MASVKQHYGSDMTLDNLYAYRSFMASIIAQTVVPSVAISFTGFIGAPAGPHLNGTKMR
jgi:hypothetical protein